MKSTRKLIVTSSATTIIGLLLTVIALGTKYWICKGIVVGKKRKWVFYGLFDKILEKATDNNVSYDLYVTTITFLVASCIFGIVSSTITVLNVFYDKLPAVLSTRGLYLWNSFAVLSNVLAMITFAILFGKTFFEYVYQYDVKMDSLLYYSYWLIFASLYFYVGSVIILITRQRKIAKELKEKCVEQGPDPTALMY